jgi:elongation factor 1-alpha
MTTIITKIKNKEVLFEYIQGFVSIRHYILPFLINKDKILQNQLKIFNSILVNNQLSSNFMKNLKTFISDRILFRIINEEDLMNDKEKKKHVPEGVDNYRKLKKRILKIYKRKEIYNTTKIDINDLKKYIPNEKEFVLFILDFLENKKQILSIFPDFYLEEGKNDLIRFNSYYNTKKFLFEDNKKINRKMTINVAFIGNKDSGKSTTVGHLLYSTGNIEPKLFTETINATDAFELPSYKFSWLLDRIWEERTFRKTVIPHIKKLETKKYNFNLIDLPGDFKLKKNIIKGLSLAEVAVIIVKANNDIIDVGHIKDYLIIAFTMGISQLIIAVNKMDETPDSKYSENIFIKIKKYMVNLCKNIGFNIYNIQIIAYSGLTGQNLVNRYEDEDLSHINKMEWYKGKTLIESLDELEQPEREFDDDDPLIISIFQSDKITGFGTVVEGKILSGKLVKNIDLNIPVKKEIYKVKSHSIEIHNEQYDEAFAGDIIGVNINRVSVRDLHFTYLVFTENSITNIKNANNLRVEILMIDKNRKLRIRSALTLFCYTFNVPIKIIKIEYIVDKTNKILVKEPKEIKNGERAFIIIKLGILYKKYSSSYHAFEDYEYSAYFDKYINNSILGSFVLCNDNLIAVGKIHDINVNV